MIVNLIAATTTRVGLRVQAAPDIHHYATTTHVTDAELARLNITPYAFHIEWNGSLGQSRWHNARKPLTT